MRPSTSESSFSPPGGLSAVGHDGRIGGPAGVVNDDLAMPIIAFAALVLLAGAQLLLPGAGPAPMNYGLAPRRPLPVTPPMAADYPAILRAPVFAPDRRPGEAAMPVAGAAAAVGSLAGYAALGAATGRGVATAVVSGATGVKTLHPGDLLEGWRLVGLDQTRLTFERAGSRHVLVVGAPAEAVAGAPGVTQ